jgi:hypothetical protein
VRELVERHLYDNIEQFMEIAACNQLALEAGATAQELIDAGHRNLPTLFSSSEGSVDSLESAGSGKVSKPSADQLVLGPFQVRKTWPRHLEPHPNTIRPEAEPIWGQVNRLLPFKIACRWIAVYAAENGVWPRLRSIADRLADDAAKLGSALAEADTRAKRVRDDQLATSLPKVGNLASKDRYLSHFLARITRAGRVYPGAIFQYGLAEPVDDRVVLTTAGFNFAALPNPILDESIDAASSSLSDQEKSLLQQQIIGFVPTECRDFSNVLLAVLDGHDTPSSLAAVVFDSLPANSTTAAKQTHLSGVVARLAELGVIRRLWNGRRVTYEAAKLEGLPLFDHIAQTVEQ